MKNTIFCLFVLYSMLLSNNKDTTTTTMIHIQYGYGNFFSALDHSDLADKANYNEFLISLEKNTHREFGVSLLLSAIYNNVSGFGICEGVIPYHYEVNSKAFLGLASFYINWKYAGFKFGLLGFKRELGFCDENPVSEFVFPTIDIKIGLNHKVYFIVSGPEDFILSPVSIGFKYHFSGYFSNIWFGKTIADNAFNLYAAKAQIQVLNKIAVSIQGFTNFSKNHNGMRVGLVFII